MDIVAVASRPFDQPTRSTWRAGARHVAALVAVAIVVTALELPATDFDHGTHLLVLLTLIIGIAFLFGPGPAAIGLAAGGGLAAVASAITIQGALVTPHAYVQLAAYLLAGGACIALVAVASRYRRAASLPQVRAPVRAVALVELVEPLTEREAEVLHLAATGIPVDEIAHRMYLSPNTVKTHLTHVYGKLGVHSRCDAVRAALHSGCLSPDDICPHMTAAATAESPVQVMSEHRNG